MAEPVLAPSTRADSPRRAVFDATRLAPPPRTLIDILEESARLHPEAAALDDGRLQLDYSDLLAEVATMAGRLAESGVGGGDRVGIRVPSGTVDLYIAILGVLAAGAAYVPVDADDPDERAELVFGEAGVRAVVTEGLVIEATSPTAAAVPDVSHTAPEPSSPTESTPPPPPRPTPESDAWIIFTSGSTGKPKGVAVTHRNAAAFVDAEATLFLAKEPIAPGDRVLAGLSVAFDASCEEMWLAWRNGACLVPAPRSLVRSGVDLGPWLVDNAVTVVSTVPTLASLWPADALDEIRLLIFGGEACPPELADRLAVDGREVWNTYGPTEATVVATASPLLGGGETVRIGLPLDGWSLVVVDPAGEPVAMGESGELVIGGVGLARYLDPVKDAEKYAPLPSMAWERAYRSGDLVRAEAEGLVFLGRADEQVKLGGRRIELGEVDAALQALPGVAGAAAAVKTTAAGNQILVGYVVPIAAAGPAGTAEPFDMHAARELLAQQLPAALIPRIAVLEDLPSRTSGKVDRNALPWPLPGVEATADVAELTDAEAWLAERWESVLGERPTNPATDFFDAGGSSLVAAKFVSALRADHPTVTVRDVYDNPTLAGLAKRLQKLTPKNKAAAKQEAEPRAEIRPVPLRAQLTQAVLMIPLATLGALRPLTLLAALADLVDAPWAPKTSWWWVLAGFAAFVTPIGRIAVAAGGARLLLRGTKPGEYPRGGSVHLRLWTAEQLAARIGVLSAATGPWNSVYARALGAKIGENVDLHSPPPITGMLTVGHDAAVEPEVDLTGYWLDGDTLRIGEIRVDAGASIGARSTLSIGAEIGDNARVAPGSSVASSVKAGQLWSGSPAKRAGKAGKFETPARRTRTWSALYGGTAIGLGLFPLIAAIPALAILWAFIDETTTTGQAWAYALAGLAPATVAFLIAYAALTLLCVRALGFRLTPGDHPLHSGQAWKTWTTLQLMSMARVWLYPVYASSVTPNWLRALGMKVGKGVEMSTVLAVPSMTTVNDGAFLADDTMVASYEMFGGRLRVGEVRIGKRVFIGNSGMVGPGRKLPKESLVGVLSAAPSNAKRGRSYLGMPPERLRRPGQDVDDALTYNPPRKLRVARATIEILRVIPAIATAALLVTAAAVLAAIADHDGLPAAALSAGIVVLGAGFAAAAIATLAKWVLVGRIAAVDHPLWSSFVWRNELADNFIELLAAPWFAEPWLGTGPLNFWLRSLGSKIGRGVWCETYWLPEADLVELGDGASVNRGCVVQTHLFHDRVMSMDTVTVAAGATLGPQGVILPAATIGARATIGPASLVMRGESVPAGTRWIGNPIEPWRERQ